MKASDIMNEPICAISTALGVGAIAIIRISGENSIAKVAHLFDGVDLTKVKSHTIHYGHIIKDKEIIDEVLVTIMKAPKTYTMEDTVEINTHGGIATTRKVLEVLQEEGIRLAEPGEFTRRAFINGRLDLTEAEAVANLINSETELERKLALTQIQGKLSQKIKKIRDNLIDLMANIEVNIDFPEYEDALVITNENIKSYLTSAQEELTKLIEDAKVGKIIEQGIKVALVGRPNVGKSSILNALLNQNKAIVTDIAGTTRDLVEGEVELEGIRLKFIDTAGIRETKDVVEKIGVDKSLEALQSADLVIHVLSNNEELTKDDEEIINTIKNKTSLTFINKTDLSSKLNIDDLKEIINNELILGNTTEVTGLDNLKKKIIELFNLENIKTSNLEIASGTRVINLIKEALKSIKNALKDSKEEVPVDMLAIDIKKAWTLLGEITGETYQDELLDTLFSKFCLGK